MKTEHFSEDVCDFIFFEIVLKVFGFFNVLHLAMFYLSPLTFHSDGGGRD
jgi:hypothetical protein